MYFPRKMNFFNNSGAVKVSNLPSIFTLNVPPVILHSKLNACLSQIAIISSFFSMVIVHNCILLKAPFKATSLSSGTHFNLSYISALIPLLSQILVFAGIL